MHLDEDFLLDLTRTVWTTVLGLEADQTASRPDGDPLEVITTSVDITGAWEGTISLTFSPSLGRRLAAAMLECPESEATPALVRDVGGELANVLGGNVKGILPGPCNLSLPRIEAGLSVQGGPVVAQRVWFDCAGQPFSVTVRSRTSQVRSTS
jgi:chemotaxis protein CheX